MLPDRASNPGPLTYESGALPIALRGPAVGTSNGRRSDIKLRCNISTTSFRRHMPAGIRVLTVYSFGHITALLRLYCYRCPKIQ